MTMPLPESLGALGIERALFQAPIGSIAGPELAAAVCNAGGVGHFAGTWRTREQLLDTIGAIKRQTNKPFGANFVVDFPIEENVAAALDAGVRIISFFWGDGAPHLRRVKAAGALAIQVAGSVDEAKRAADAGFDL